MLSKFLAISSCLLVILVLSQCQDMDTLVASGDGNYEDNESGDESSGLSDTSASADPFEMSGQPRKFLVSLVLNGKRFDAIFTSNLKKNFVTVYKDNNVIAINLSQAVCANVLRTDQYDVFLGCENMILTPLELATICPERAADMGAPVQQITTNVCSSYQAVYVTPLTMDNQLDVSKVHVVDAAAKKISFFKVPVCVPYKQLQKVYFLRNDFINWKMMIVAEPDDTKHPKYPITAFPSTHYAQIQEKLDATTVDGNETD